jgi:hypothetical protein
LSLSAQCTPDGELILVEESDMKKYYVLPCNVHETDAGMPEYCMFHDAAEVDTVLKRQAAAAISGMNAATAISSGQVQQAHRLRAESNPEALESERQANAILTAELDTMNLAVGYFHEENDRLITRIAELEKALSNCRLLAMKRLHKGAVEKADWEAILRFCTEAGCGPSPLRADS